MTHPGLETLLAHLDGELTLPGAQEVTRHLARCATCTAAAARLRETSTIFAGALSTLDAAEPASWQDAPARSTDAGASASEAVAGPVEVASSRRARSGAQRPLRDAAGPRAGAGALRRAALYVLFTAAAASAAVLGGRALLSDAEQPPAPVVESTAAAPTVAAVSVTPQDGRVFIALDAVAGVRVHIVLAAVADASIAIENAAAPHVTVSGNEVRVRVQDRAATVRITLPADIRAAEVTAGGAVVVRVRDGVVTPQEALSGGVLIGSRSQSAP